MAAASKQSYAWSLLRQLALVLCLLRGFVSQYTYKGYCQALKISAPLNAVIEAWGGQGSDSSGLGGGGPGGSSSGGSSGDNAGGGSALGGKGGYVKATVRVTQGWYLGIFVAASGNRGGWPGGGKGSKGTGGGYSAVCMASTQSAACKQPCPKDQLLVIAAGGGAGNSWCTSYSASSGPGPGGAGGGVNGKDGGGPSGAGKGNGGMSDQGGAAKCATCFLLCDQSGSFEQGDKFCPYGGGGGLYGGGSGDCNGGGGSSYVVSTALGATRNDQGVQSGDGKVNINFLTITPAPAARPTTYPVSRPTVRPTPFPVARPSTIPTARATLRPSSYSTLCPTARATLRPTFNPTICPTARPTLRPTSYPTLCPTARPTSSHSPLPTVDPFNTPNKYHFTGLCVVLPIPRNVNAIIVNAWGGAGGDGTSSGAFGGKAGYVQATVPVTPGWQLAILVGASGANGGWPGGGRGASTQFNGGGLSEVSMAASNACSSTRSVLVVVGGGGAGNAAQKTNGGVGGGLSGQSGQSSIAANNGAGGSQTAGGATACLGGTTGGFEKGGSCTTGSGGGSGYYGGGAGTYAGGGGSSYFVKGAQITFNVQGDLDAGDGEVDIQFVLATPTAAPVPVPTPLPRYPSPQPSSLPTLQPIKATSRPSQYPSPSPTPPPSPRPSPRPSSRPSPVPSPRSSGRPSQPSMVRTGSPTSEPSTSQPSGESPAASSEWPTSQPSSSAPIAVPIPTPSSLSPTVASSSTTQSPIPPMPPLLNQSIAALAAACPRGSHVLLTQSRLTPTCKQCQPGTFTSTPGVVGNCSVCRPGTAAGSSGSSFCPLCPVGQYTSKTRATFCTPCSDGLVTAEAGATSASQCLSPIANFLIGTVALLVSMAVAVIYLGSQRFRLIAQLRCRRVWSIQMEASRSALSAIKAHTSSLTEALWQRKVERKIVIAYSGQTKTDAFVEKVKAALQILNFCLWAVLSVGVAIAGTAIVFCLFLLKVFFGTLILWKQTQSVFHSPQEFSAVIREASLAIFASLHARLDLGGLWTACDAVFISLFNPLLVWASKIQFEFNVGVTCTGSAGPLHLLIDICVLGCVIVAVESGMQASRYMLSSFLGQYCNFLYGSDHRQHCTRRLLVTSKHWHWYLTNALALLQTLLLWAASSLLNAQTILQFLLSMSQLSVFVQQDGHHKYSEECDHVLGLEGFDKFLALSSTAVAFLLFLPVVYCVASVICPGGDNLWETDGAQSSLPNRPHSLTAANVIDEIPSFKASLARNTSSSSSSTGSVTVTFNVPSSSLLFHLSYLTQAIGSALSSDLHLAAFFGWALDRLRARLAFGRLGDHVDVDVDADSRDSRSFSMSVTHAVMENPLASTRSSSSRALARAVAAKVPAVSDGSNSCSSLPIRRLLAPATAGSLDSLWLSSRLAGLPSYFSLLRIEAAELLLACGLRSSLGIIILATIFTVLPLGHVVTSSGRRAWASVFAKYTLFLRAAVGLVDRKTVETFDLVPQAEAMRAELDSKTRLNERYAASLDSSIAPRSVLLQLIPQLTPLSLFAIATARCAIFSSRDSGLHGRLFDLLISDPFTRAYEENSGWRHPDQSWANVLGGVSLFLLKSRLLQWVLNTYIVLMSIALLYLPHSNTTIASAALLLMPFSFAYSLYAVVMLGKAMGVRDLTAILCPSDGEMAMIRALKDDSKGRGVLVEMLAMRRRFREEQEAIVENRMERVVVARDLVEEPPPSSSFSFSFSRRTTAADAPPLMSSDRFSLQSRPQTMQSLAQPAASRPSVFPFADVYRSSYEEPQRELQPSVARHQQQQHQRESRREADDDASANAQSRYPQLDNERIWAHPRTPVFSKPTPLPVAIPPDARRNLRHVPETLKK